MASKTVRDAMTEDVLAVKRSTTLDEVYELMHDNLIRHVPVVDGSDELVGIVSHRDLAAALGEYVKGPMMKQSQLLEGRTAQDIMARGLETVSPDDDLVTAAEILLENKFGCLPVVEGAHLIGILTEADFVKIVAGR